MSLKPVFHKRYQATALLAEGSMGRVYLAGDVLHKHRQVVVKTILKQKMTAPMVSQFKREYSLMTRLRHPFLARVYDFGFDRHQDAWFIVMEYIRGKSLRQTISSAHLSRAQVIPLFVNLCRAVAFIHSRDILHRDLKPANILLAGDIKIVDFGLAEHAVSAKRAKGTLRYLAPEILDNQLGRTSDIFALGLILYEMWAGVSFWQDMASTDILYHLGHADAFAGHWERVLALVTHDAFRQLLANLTHFWPDKRFQYAAEIIHALNGLLGRRFAVETPRTRKAYVNAPVFIGRDREMAGLANRLSDLGGEHKLVLLSGAAGIGKTRLIEEFKHLCRLRDTAFFQGFCLPHLEKPYAPFDDILKEMLLRTPGHLLARYGPELKKLMLNHPALANIAVNPKQDPEVEQGIMQESVTGFLIDHVRDLKQKTVFVFHNLHHADSITLQIIHELFHKLENSRLPLLCCATVNDGSHPRLEPFLKAWKDEDRLVLMPLEPLRGKQIRLYLEAMFGASETDRSLYTIVPDIEKHVGGNLLFLRELLVFLVDQRAIVHTGRYWQMALPFDKVRLPGSLYDIIAKRYRSVHLSQDSRRVLEVLALVNDFISIRALNLLLQGRLERPLALAIKELENADLLATIEIENYIFYRTRNKILSHVIAQAMPEKEESLAHLARGLEKIYQGNLEEYAEGLAYFFQQAGMMEKAAHYLERAADRARELFANAQALELYKKLLDMIGPDQKKRRIITFFKMGQILTLNAEHQQAREYLNQALALARDIGGSLLIASYSRLAALYTDLLDFNKAMELLIHALALCEQGGGKKDKSLIYGQLGALYYKQENYDQALSYLNKELRLGRETGAKEQMGHAYHLIGTVHLLTGDYSRALASLQQHLAISRQRADKRGIGIAVANLGVLYLRQGRLQEAMDCYRKQLLIAMQLGHKHSQGTALCNIGTVYWERGDYLRAMDFFKRYLQLSEEIHDAYGRSIALGNIAESLLVTGRFAEAEERLQDSIDLAEKTANKGNLAYAYGNMAQLRKYQDRPSEALAWINRGIEAAKDLHLPYLCCAFLYQKALLLFRGDRLKQAASVNDEARQMARTVQREEILFFTTLLYQRLRFAASGKQAMASALACVRGMLADTRKVERLAALHEHLYAMTGEAQHGIRAISLYREMYSGTPNVEYRLRAEALEKAYIEQSAWLYDREAAALSRADKQNRMELVLAESRLLLRHGRPQAATAGFSAALDMAHDIADKAIQGLCHYHLALLQADGKQFCRAQAHCDHALSLLDPRQHPAKLRDLYRLQAQLYQQQGRLDQTRNWLERFLSASRREKDFPGMCQALLAMEEVARKEGRHIQALRYNRRLLGLARERGEKALLLRVLHNIALLSETAGWKDKAKEYRQWLLRAAKEDADPQTP